MPNFGELLRRYRRQAGFTQEHLAERALLSATAIGALERGLHRAPRRETVALLAKALDLSKAEEAALETAANANRARVAPSDNDGLPVASSSFVGRENETATLRGIVLSGKRRLVTITGPGGVGKSRFALETARLIADDFNDGVRLIPLVSVKNPQFVSIAILSALGVQERGDRDIAELLQRSLKGRSILLVLDNCEHLLDSVASVVVSILATSPATRFLLTSRERLRVAGEFTFDLSALSYPIGLPETAAEAIEYSAIQLFLDRALSLSAGAFELGDDNLGPISEIVRRLDGLPLAIELAAPLLRVLSLTELAKRLKDRFQLLATGDREALPHHRSLSAMIEWSSERLSGPERLLFRRSAAFIGSFSLEAITAVCGHPPLQQSDVLPLLCALIDKSLVRVVDRNESRYDLLDVVHEYAKNLASDATEASELSRRHAEYYLKIARETNPETTSLSPSECLRRLKPDAANFEAALTWALVERGDPPLGAELAVALGWFFFLDSYLRARHWFDCAMEMLDPSTSPRTFARLIFKLCFFTHLNREVAKYLPNLEQAVSFYRRIDDPKGLTFAFGWLAVSLAVAGESARAEAAAIESVAAARRSEPHHLVWALQNYAIVLKDSKIETQRALLTESLAISERNGMDALTVVAMSGLGYLAFYAGDIDGAVGWTREALDFLRRTSTAITTRSAVCLGNLAGFLLLRGDVDEGISAAQEALQLTVQMDDPDLIACVIQHLATASMLRGDPARAALLLGFAAARIRSGNPVFLQLELHFCARLSRMLASALSDTERETLSQAGEGWTEERAVEEARAVT
jgi:predicted ATPase/DNA-binding XRE family transcriptional regulator